MKTILVDAVDTLVTEKGDMFQDLYQLLEQFPNPKIVLTNARDDKFLEYGLDKLPYTVFTLRQEPPKTDPQYFKTMLRHFGLTVDDVVYFEHNPDAVKSAKSAGILSYHYNPDKRDLAALKQFLVQNL